MKSTLVLYEDSQILIDKNTKVDYIGDYLNTLTKLTLNNLNYIEPKRELSLKIELSQTNLDMGSDNTHNYNYAKVTTDNVDYFYFITNYKWIAVSVIAIDLYMDTINSFVFKNQGASGLVDYEITPKSLIHRQHKDRWTYEEDMIVPFTPVIDRVNEEINPVLYKTIERDILDDFSMLLNQKWYLVYINREQIVETDYNQVNPVDILIAPEHSTPIATSYQLTITASMLSTGYTGISSFIQDNKNEALEVEISGTTYLLEWFYDKIGVNAGKKWIWIRLYKAHASDMTFNVDIMQTITDSTGMSQLYTSVQSSITGLASIDLFNPPSKVRSYNAVNAFTWAIIYNKTNSPSAVREIANGIDSLDRTNSRLIKIIELPYCPLEVDPDLTSNGEIYFSHNVVLDDDEDFIKISPNRYGYEQRRGAFKHKISVDNYVFPSGMLTMIDNCIDRDLKTDQSRDNRLETKLYSSEFIQTKYVYDSFNLIIKYEYLALWESLMAVYDENQDGIQIELDTPITIASKFGFKFLGYEPYNSIEDYDLFLPVARNNELPIYSSQYINYLRTGFNYDIKAKNQQATASGMSIGLATLGAVAGIGLGIASNNPAVLAGAVISAITAVTSATTSAINNAISSQRSIEQKLAQAKAQAVNIQGCDDIDLLDEYTKGNKMKLCRYECSPVMYKNIADLFYYTGYKVEALGLPDTTSRMRFNYVSADIDIIMQKHLPKDIIEDIKARWSLGITFMHKLTTDLTRYPYNFEQDLENWEWSLEDAIQISE